MGHLKPNPGEGKTSAMIKYLFLLALLGAVFCEPEPEAAPVSKSDPSADPYYYYYGGYPYYRHGYYGGYYGHRYGYLYGRKKREAEPEPVVVVASLLPSILRSSRFPATNSRRLV